MRTIKFRGKSIDTQEWVYGDLETAPTKELKIQVPDGYEIDKEKSTFEHIVFKEKEEVKPWNPEGKNVVGFLYDSDGNIYEIGEYPYDSETDLNMFATEKELKSALAMAQISLILKYDKRYGGRVDGEEFDGLNVIYVIDVTKRKITVNPYMYTCFYLAFHTKEQAELFLEEHEDLVRQYYMLD